MGLELLSGALPACELQTGGLQNLKPGAEGCGGVLRPGGGLLQEVGGNSRGDLGAGSRRFVRGWRGRGRPCSGGRRRDNVVAIGKEQFFHFGDFGDRKSTRLNSSHITISY